MNAAKQITITEEYEHVCKILANTFANKYFGKKVSDMWCVGSDPTDVWCINEKYFSCKDMYEYIKYKYTAKKMFERYYYVNETHIENSNKKDKDKQYHICIRDYKKLKNVLII